MQMRTYPDDNVTTSVAWKMSRPPRSVAGRLARLHKKAACRSADATQCSTSGTSSIIKHRKRRQRSKCHNARPSTAPVSAQSLRHVAYWAPVLENHRLAASRRHSSTASRSQKLEEGDLNLLNRLETHHLKRSWSAARGQWGCWGSFRSPFARLSRQSRRARQ